MKPNFILMLNNDFQFDFVFQASRHHAWRGSDHIRSSCGFNENVYWKCYKWKHDIVIVRTRL